MQLKYVSALPRSACSAHTHYKRISHYGFCAWWSEISFIVCSCDSSAKHLHKHTAAAKHVFIFHPICLARARDILLCAALSLFVCVPRFAARVITACRNKLANTNINRELRKRVVSLSDDDSFSRLLFRRRRQKKVGGC